MFLARTKLALWASLAFAATSQAGAPGAEVTTVPTLPTCASGLLKGMDFVVVLDITTADDGTTVSRVFSFPNDATNKDIAPSLAALNTISASTPEAVEKTLTQSASELSAVSTTRWRGMKGKSVVAIAFYDNTTSPTLTFSEIARASRIATDFATLTQLATKIRGTSMTAGEKIARVIACTSKPYTLRQERANLTIATSLPATSGVAADAASVKTTLVTGPKEALFISANAGVSTASQVKYDPTAKTLGTAQTPKEFYVAFNFSLSDLYDDRAANGNVGDEIRMFFTKGYLGVAVEGSSSPLNQLGAIVGTRWIPGVSHWISVDAVSPFIGYLWTRNDALTPATGSSAAAVTKRFSAGSMIWGLSLNLSQALSWVGSAVTPSAKPAPTK